MKNIFDLAHDPEVQAGIQKQMARNGLKPDRKCDSLPVRRKPGYRPLLVPRNNQSVPYPDLEEHILELIQPILDWHRVTLKQLLSASRDQLTFDCRRECILAARIATDATVTQLGRFFRRDHTSICYVLKHSAPSAYTESLLTHSERPL